MISLYAVAAPRSLSGRLAVALGLSRRHGPAVQSTAMLILVARWLALESSCTRRKSLNHDLGPIVEPLAVYSWSGGVVRVTN